MASINTDPLDERRPPRRMTFAVWRSPLARSADRTEAGLLLVAVTLWLIAVPVFATAASIIWSGISDSAAVQQQTRTTATAHLLADVPDFSSPAEYGTQITPSVSVSAEWKGPDGRSHTGSVDAADGARTGDQMPIWVDASGNLADPPISTGTAAVLMVAATVVAWFTWGMLLIGCWLVVRWRLNRRRIGDWDDEWAAIEPVWSGR